MKRGENYRNKLFLAIALLLFVSLSILVSEKVSGLSSGIEEPNELKVLTSSNLENIEIKNRAEESLFIKSGKSQLISLPFGEISPGEPFELFIARLEKKIIMQPYSNRAKDYAVYISTQNGLIKQSSGVVKTFRGIIEGEEDSLVAGAITGEGLSLTISVGGDNYRLQPIGKDISGDENLHILFNVKDTDVSEEIGTLEEDTESSETQSLSEYGGDQNAAITPGTKIAELAIDTDYEYYLAYGGSISAIENRVNEIVNTVNIQYERDVGINHKVTAIVIRPDINDPYSTFDVHIVKSQLFYEWLEPEYSEIKRDTVQLFSGHSFDVGGIGSSYVGTICTNYAVSVIAAEFSTFARTTDLSAHELGHNWNAVHCSTVCYDPPYTMYNGITPQPGNRFHPVATMPLIKNFASTLTCLDVCSIGDSDCSGCITQHELNLFKNLYFNGYVGIGDMSTTLKNYLQNLEDPNCN